MGPALVPSATWPTNDELLTGWTHGTRPETILWNVQYQVGPTFLGLYNYNWQGLRQERLIFRSSRPKFNGLSTEKFPA